MENYLRGEFVWIISQICYGALVEPPPELRLALVLPEIRGNLATKT